MNADDAGGAVDVVIEAGDWAGAGLDALAPRACGAALAHIGRPGAEVVVLGCDDARIAALNADFRGKPRATNVLSWPSVEHVAHAPGAVPVPPDTDAMGDIAIAFGICTAEAAAQGKPLADHVTHLLIHATLHLAGYDHENDADAAVMEAAERVILAGLGIRDPYAEPAPPV
ncbi:MAG: rRNA maturation RNase YbeY [Paracoccus sp. (in: a-proteobacteria)]|nr:rRNA maturation RNase YbeY [Paracoccus sp. (in: a-proteobacteria)]